MGNWSLVRLNDLEVRELTMLATTLIIGTIFLCVAFLMALTMDMLGFSLAHAPAVMALRDWTAFLLYRY